MLNIWKKSLIDKLEDFMRMSIRDYDNVLENPITIFWNELQRKVREIEKKVCRELVLLLMSLSILVVVLKMRLQIIMKVIFIKYLEKMFLRRVVEVVSRGSHL